MPRGHPACTDSFGQDTSGEGSPHRAGKPGQIAWRRRWARQAWAHQRSARCPGSRAGGSNSSIATRLRLVWRPTASRCLSPARSPFGESYQDIAMRPYPEITCVILFDPTTGIGAGGVHQALCLTPAADQRSFAWTSTPCHHDHLDDVTSGAMGVVLHFRAGLTFSAAHGGFPRHRRRIRRDRQEPGPR
jgi:hypothetical protein